jgi:hypothetical protein
MYGLAEFGRDVFEAFGFLESEYGMQRTDHSAGPEACVVYENALARVSVNFEAGAHVPEESNGSNASTQYRHCSAERKERL